MANAPYLKQADSGVWYVHWTVNRIGKRVSARTTDQAKAAAFLSDWLNKKDGVDRSELSRPNVKIRDLWPYYASKHKGIGEVAANAAWRQLDPFFGSLLATGLRQSHIDCYVDDRTSGKLGRAVLPQTAAKELSYLLAALNYCADPRRGILPPNQKTRFDLPEKGDPRDRWLKTDEIVKLFAAARRLSKGDRLSRGERFLWLALETAGRVQALLDLTWDRVDFETGMISLNVPGRKKTKKRRAEVPMSKALRPILLRAYDERDGDLVLDTKAPIWTTLQHIAIEAGLAPKQVLRSGKKPAATGVSPHVLRHTAATHMARRGVSLFLIAKVLGNSVTVVERTYAKYAPGDLQGAVDKISNGTLEMTT